MLVSVTSIPCHPSPSMGELIRNSNACEKEAKVRSITAVRVKNQSLVSQATLPRRVIGQQETDEC